MIHRLWVTAWWLRYSWTLMRINPTDPDLRQEKDRIEDRLADVMVWFIFGGAPLALSSLFLINTPLAWLARWVVLGWMFLSVTMMVGFTVVDSVRNPGCQ